MLTKKIIKEYKEKNDLTLQFNFLINKTDKAELVQIAKNNGLTTSELLRIMIKECIKQQKER